MTAADTQSHQPAPARRLSARVIGGIVAIAVVVAMALDTTYRKPGEATAGGREEFDPTAYGESTFPKVAAAVEEAAVPLPTLVKALKADPEAAGEEYGNRQGSSPYNFATTGEGVAGRAEGGLLPVRVKGVPKDTQVSIQVGQAINGTALRDVTGTIEFGQFLNQVEYAGAGTALNTQVKEKVLKGIDAKALEGETISFTGAFTLLAPTSVTIVPTRLEVAG